MVKLQRGAQHPVSFVFAEINGYRRIDLAHPCQLSNVQQGGNAMRCVIHYIKLLAGMDTTKLSQYLQNYLRY